MHRSTVKEVFSLQRGEDIVLEMFDGTYLNRDTKISVVKQFRYGKLNDYHDSPCVCLDSCRLKKGMIRFDPDPEGKQSLAQKTAAIMKQGRIEIEGFDPDAISSDEDVQVSNVFPRQR